MIENNKIDAEVEKSPNVLKQEEKTKAQPLVFAQKITKTVSQKITTTTTETILPLSVSAAEKSLKAIENYIQDGSFSHLKNIKITIPISQSDE